MNGGTPERAIDPRRLMTRADRRDAPLLAGLIARAFQDLPPARWLVPDPRERARILPATFTLSVAHALRYGQVVTDVQERGVAVWFDRTGAPPPDINGYDARLAAACGAHTDRFRTLDGLFTAHHPDEAHHHLAFLAVDLPAQGRGVGSALLHHHHARLDAAGIPAYLEASSARNRALYHRHGYVDLGDPFCLPDGTPFWPMWRHPRHSTAAEMPTPTIRRSGRGPTARSR